MSTTTSTITADSTTAETTSSTTSASGGVGTVRAWFCRLPQLGRDATCLLFFLPVQLAVGWCLVVPLTLLGAIVSIFWVGVPILAAALRLAGGLADLARRALPAVDGSAPVAAHYLGVEDGRGVVRQVLTTVRDPQRWADVAWVVVSFPVALVLWTATVVWLLLAAGGLVAPLIELVAPQAWSGWAQALGLRPALLWTALIDLPLGILLAVAAPYALRGMASLLSGLTRAMLSWRGEVGRLRTSRNALQRAEADTRRRLERDIHDGPQQRLVRLNMDLARARRQLARDPQAADEILEESMAHTQSALDELRRLSRGIAPPVLVDQGLGAAVSEAAAVSGVPVTLGAGMSELPELADHVAQAAYFLVSEALTNVNKHSQASAAHVGASLDGGNLWVWVDDDGVGGASPAKGHGLAGLAQRLEGVDGRLVVTSPPGGPTRVSAVIPCAS